MKNLLTIVSLGLCAVTLSAALLGVHVDEAKKKAAEVLRVEITKVTTFKSAGFAKDVIYDAKVVKTERSKGGLKPGDTIRIKSYYVKKDAEFAGPLPPELLVKGWKGRVYLNAGDGKAPYGIAIYGHSFEAP